MDQRVTIELRQLGRVKPFYEEIGIDHITAITSGAWISETAVMLVTRHLFVDVSTTWANALDSSTPKETMMKLMAFTKTTRYSIMPVCDSSHWTLFILISSADTIQVFHVDPLHPRTGPRSIFTSIKRACAALDVDWIELDSPQQTNMNDCAIYVLSAIKTFASIMQNMETPLPMEYFPSVFQTALAATPVMTRDDATKIVRSYPELSAMMSAASSSPEPLIDSASFTKLTDSLTASLTESLTKSLTESLTKTLTESLTSLTVSPSRKRRRDEDSQPQSSSPKQLLPDSRSALPLRSPPVSTVQPASPPFSSVQPAPQVSSSTRPASRCRKRRKKIDPFTRDTLRKQQNRKAYKEARREKLEALEKLVTKEDEIRFAINELAETEGKAITIEHLQKYKFAVKNIDDAEIKKLKDAAVNRHWLKMPLSRYLQMLDLSFFSNGSTQDLARISGVTTTTFTTKVSQVRRIVRLMEEYSV